jgi:hypothetical protein
MGSGEWGVGSREWGVGVVRNGNGKLGITILIYILWKMSKLLFNVAIVLNMFN